MEGEADTEAAVHLNADQAIYRYTIDRDDRITGVSDNWLAFAVDNDGADTCHPDRIVGHLLWKFINDIETRTIYRMILETVRVKQRRVSFPFRCDSPDKRRYFEMTVVPEKEAHVEFLSHLRKTKPRPALKLFDAKAGRSDEKIRICSMCRKIEVAEHKWVEAEKAVSSLKLLAQDHLPILSHGICLLCFDMVLFQLDNE